MQVTTERKKIKERKPDVPILKIDGDVLKMKIKK